MQVKWLEDGEVHSALCEPGDFIYIKPGQPHNEANASDTEPLELIFTYAGTNSTDGAGTKVVEAPAGDTA